MKKILYSMLVLMAAFTFTSCEDVPAPYDIPSEDGGGDDIVDEEATGDGTLANPFNSVAANEYASALGADVESDTAVYIKGKVVSIRENFSTTYGNATFYISDTGTSTNQFYVYRAYYLGNKRYTSGDLLEVGDEVVVYGKVINYSGNTPETVQGETYVYSINGETDSSDDSGDDDSGDTTGTNIISNGDFESWTNGTPDNWSTTSTAGNATLSQSTDCYEGTYSVLVGGDASYNKRLGYKETTLKAGTYTMSFYAKAATSTGGTVRAGYVAVVDGSVSGSYVYADDYIDLETSSWTQVTYSFTLSTETTVCLVVMNSKSPGGDVLIDNFTLTTSNGGISDGSSSGDDSTTGYSLVTSISNGDYIIAANTSGSNYVVATPLSSTYTYGYLYTESATLTNGILSASDSNAFTFTAVDGGYTIQDGDGRYYYMTGTYNSFNVSTSLPSSGYVWTVSFNSDGTVNITNTAMSKTLQYSSSYSSYGAYSSISNTLPCLFAK